MKRRTDFVQADSEVTNSRVLQDTDTGIACVHLLQVDGIVACEALEALDEAAKMEFQRMIELAGTCKLNKTRVARLLLYHVIDELIRERVLIRLNASFNEIRVMCWIRCYKETYLIKTGFEFSIFAMISFKETFYYNGT